MVSTPFLSTPPCNYGGTELVIWELAEGLVEQGHEVTVFATGDSRTSGELRWLFERAQWPPDPLADVNHATWAFGQIARDSFDVVHVHGTAALALSRVVPDVPMIYTIHHERTELLSSFYRYFPDVKFVAISEDQRRREIELPDISVVHHGLDASRYESSGATGSHVCFIGRLAQVKGPHIAIDAATKAGVAIRVAGDVHPPDRVFAAAELEHRMRQPNVHCLGVVGMDAKVDLLRHARAALMPIQWNEPFGLVVIEAMLCGCPLIGFPRGSLPELIEPGLTGFLVEDEEEMSRLIRPGSILDYFDRARCRERAVQRFGRTAMVEAYVDVYQEAVAGPGPGLRLWA
jgi:glycosyltransferase involved in cell wall biosynthesis